jgi:hypothetical protein
MWQYSSTFCHTDVTSEARRPPKSRVAMDGVVSPERPDRRRIPDQTEKNVLNVTQLLSC